MSCKGPETSTRFSLKQKSEILLAEFHFYASVENALHFPLCDLPVVVVVVVVVIILENALHFPLCDLPTQVMDLVL